MGVSGSGKSTVGREVARRLGWHFIEADDFHAPTSIAKMQRGEPLTDEDREPWLAALAAEIGAVEQRGEDAVVACSALKQRYRQTLLSAATECVVVYLRGSFDLVERRMEEREHFMPAALLESQFEDLEPPAGEDVVTVDVTRPPDRLAAEIVEHVERLRQEAQR